MITLTTLEPRLLQVLQDPGAKRYDCGTLEEAVRQGLDLLNQRLPNLISSDVIVATAGRDQPLTDLGNCFTGTSVPQPVRHCWPRAGTGSEFSYLMQDGQPVCIFSGRVIPNCGDVLRVTCADGHTLTGLDSAWKHLPKLVARWSTVPPPRPA